MPDGSDVAPQPSLAEPVVVQPAPTKPALTKPSLLELCLAFAKIGLTSFGGGLTGRVRLDFVNRKRWISESNLLLGVSLAQALPGANIVNLAIWIGFDFYGSFGAAAAVASVVVPPMLTIILVAQSFAYLSAYPLTHVFLAGVALGGLAMGLGMGLFAAHRRVRDITSALMFTASFASIFVFHISTILVLAVLAPISIGLAYWKVKRDARV